MIFKRKNIVNRAESPSVARQYRALRSKMFKVVRTFLSGFILVSLLNFIFSYFFTTPKTYALSNENNELVERFRILQNNLNSASRQVEVLSERNKGIYSAVLGVDSVDRFSGIIPNNNRKYYYNHRYRDLIDHSWTELNNLAVMIANQSTALDTMQVLLANKEDMLDCLPAIWPIDKNELRGRIGAFGRRFHPILKRYHFHSGADFALNKGSAIYSTADGTVVASGYNGGYGLCVLIDHGYGYKTRYAHLQKSLVSKGQHVKRGMQIAESGNSGRSTGPHLHYEVIYRGKHINPLNYFSMEMKDEDFFNIINSAKETSFELIDEK